ncbi:amylo-alpha-1,6-glucosidase [Trinickia caryophylli]|uniref:Glycogen debranching enzyme, putative n=1 Tax=Trinickia caryophylli TaxID=28094 RepID=A0A1X7G345_TRICW|nr:amylo-alpha-1,6-glucosidase [Trinickia caryophylli]WQE14052.1 amylo-alpha-1,6-glucosidase [Trinickia caryophylli]GLU33459.1 glycogen debranching protein [Trinickia caryophylli]SMF63128.1 glycogen debranching enzyme, putative [Trinickia caryophylli]
MNLEPIEIEWHAGDDPTPLFEREWLDTNGIGGYASGTIAGVNARHYHGLLVANLASPKGRHVMLSRFDTEVRGEHGCVLLGGAEYADGRLVGDAPRYLEHFSVDRQTPTWRYRIGQSRLEQSIVMPEGQNTVLVRYRHLGGPSLSLRLRPYASFRRQDTPLPCERRRSYSLSARNGVLTLHADGEACVVHFTSSPGRAPFVIDERFEEDVVYRIERARGYDARETLYSPGHLELALAAGESASFIATTDDPAVLRHHAQAAFDDERIRIDRLVEKAPPAAQEGFAAALVAAADQFIVAPAARVRDTAAAHATGSEARTVIAGYHWFGDWGRDTMIGLEGLTLCTGRQPEAAYILKTFSRYVRNGLIPNLFPEGEREALYHTADATLWFFHALARYETATGDESLVHELFPVLEDIVAHHLRGTDFGIGMDEGDGLLHAGAPGYQLTWMDAKVGDWVVTPRRGKPVEIQGLWHNALALTAHWATRFGTNGASYERAAQRAKESFNRRFWNESRGCLFDVVDAEEGGNDASLRPNQLLAISLDHPVLAPARWRQVVDCVRRELLTPFGLRTLARGEPGYRLQYIGDLRARDAAYHQGTVWPWLFGPFVDAWLKTGGDRAQAREWLEPMAGHLREAGIGSISEIFDAEPPHHPRGCIAQAWSVAETLRAWLAAADEGSGR